MAVVFAWGAFSARLERADLTVAVIVLTVLLSVLAHGLTAGPLAVRYGARASGDGAPAAESAAAARLASRRTGGGDPAVPTTRRSA